LNDLYRGYKANLKNNNVHLANWPEEPFIETGYSSPGIGKIFDTGQKLINPLHDRLFFAGEHTQMDFFGYMEGALRSGLRAARDVMKAMEAMCDVKNTPVRTASAAPIRAKTASEYETEIPLEEHSTPDYPGEAGSPFLHQELFAKRSEEEWEPRAAALVAESPFVGAFEERRSRFDEDQLEEEEAPDELEGEDELEAEEVWEELEEEQLTSRTDQEEDEFLDDEGAPLREDEAELESPEDLEELYDHVHEHELDQGEELAELEETEGLESDEEEHFEYDIPALGSAIDDHPLREIADGQRGQLPDDILAAILTTGESDANDLTNRVFWRNHPNLSRKTLDRKDPRQKALRDEWGMILRRQVKPIIWLRQLISQLDRHREDIPREFLLGWIAAESDGKVFTLSTLGERGYFQIMWQGGEAKEQLGLTMDEFERLSINREFSIEKGVQLAKTYRHHFLQKYHIVPNGSDLLWRLTKGRHALPSALDKVLDRLVKAGTTITWQAVSQLLPKMASGVDLTLGFAAKLKPLADRVPAPAATTPEFYAESAPWIPGSGYEDRVFEVAAEQATEEDLAEYYVKEVQPKRQPKRQPQKGVPPDTRPAITFSSESKISAQEMLTKIKASKLDPWMKEVFSVNGNQLQAKKKFLLPKKGTTVPKWFQLFTNTARSNTVHVTTGEIRMTPAGVQLLGDFENGDLPGAMISLGTHGQKTFIGSPNIPDKYANGVVTLGEWRVMMVDELAGWDGKNSLRSVERKVVVIGNRQVFQKTTVAIDDEKILETFFHEVAAHQGVHDDIEFNEPKVSATDRMERSIHSEMFARYGVIGASATDSDHLAQEVSDFFGAKLDWTLYKKAKEAFTPN